MIKFENVYFSYPHKNAIKNLNLEVKDGERICLFAKSGFGKSTILKLIMGLEKIHSGELTVEGNPVFSVVFQEDRLIPQKTAEENVKLFSDIADTDALFAALGLSDIKNEYPYSLSGGMSRRVAIIRALSKQADIYLFDEPFTGIDSEMIKNCADLILKYTKGKTVIIISHSENEAALLNAKIIKL